MSMTVKDLYDATLRGEGILAKHAKANPDMPCFLLIAQDQHAAELVDKWAIWVRPGVPFINTEATGHKVTEAIQIAEAMRAWPIHKQPD